MEWSEKGIAQKNERKGLSPLTNMDLALNSFFSHLLCNLYFAPVLSSCSSYHLCHTLFPLLFVQNVPPIFFTMQKKFDFVPSVCLTHNEKRKKEKKKL